MGGGDVCLLTETAGHLNHGEKYLPPIKLTEPFGWMKTVGGLRKVRHRGEDLVDWIVTFAAAAYNLVRIRNLAATGA